MPLIGKSLIDYEVKKRIEAGTRPTVAYHEVAEELGVDRETVISTYTRGKKHLPFDTLGYDCGIEYLDGISRLYGIMNDMLGKAMYLKKCLKMIENQGDLPIAPQQMENLNDIVDDVYDEIKSCVPRSVCVECAESSSRDLLCVTCLGNGWVPK